MISGIIVLLSGFFLEGNDSQLVISFGVALSLSTFFGTLGSTMYEKTTGVLFGLFGGLFFGTYVSFYLAGPRAAFYTSFFAPIIGVIMGYSISRMVEIRDPLESDIDE